MSTIISPSAGTPLPAAAAALFERHEAGLRAYLSGLHGADAMRVETVIQEIRAEVTAQLAFEDDPTVWMFEQGRHRVLAAHLRGDMLGSGDGDGAAEDEVQAAEDPAIAVHRAFERLTHKQQETLRLKFQFGFNLAELARITGVSISGAAGLLHSAVERTCRAAGATLSLGEDRRMDVRLTAYALDELEPAEKQAFAENISDGKALLESSDAIRKVGAQLARILASGAPLPRRRRKRKAAIWQSPAVLLGVGGIAVAVALAWYFLAGGKEARTRSEVPWTVNGDSTVSVRTRHGTERESGARGAGGAAESADFGEREDRPVRAGEADWERKHFGHGKGGPGEYRQPNDPSLNPEDDSVRAGAEGGTRSPGAPTGETSKMIRQREALGRYGANDRIRPSERESSESSDHLASSAGGDGQRGRSSPERSGDQTGVAWRHAALAPGCERKECACTGGGKGSKPHGSADGGAKQREAAGAVGAAALAEGSGGSCGRDAPPNAARKAGARKCRGGTLDAGGDRTFAMEIGPIARAGHNQGEASRAAGTSARQRGVCHRCFPIHGRPEPPAPRPGGDSSSGRAAAAGGPRERGHLRRERERGTAVEPARRQGARTPQLPDGTASGGLTNGDEGLRLAYVVARRARVAVGPNVVVLCTDGNFNLGETDEKVLATHAAQAAAEGITLSVFGFGRSDRNDLRLELLATKGGGRSCYVNTREDAEQSLAGQIDGLLTPAANQVSLQLTYDSAQVDAVVRLDADADGTAPLRVENLLPGRRLAALYEIVRRRPAVLPPPVSESGRRVFAGRVRRRLSA